MTGDGHDLDPAVVAALRALAGAIGDVAPPCWSAPDLWHDRPAEAAAICLEDCHALRECGAYANAVGADQGAWGGVDRAEARKRRRAAA